MTVTRADGGIFKLLGFDYYTDGISVAADGILAGFLEGFGSWDTALNGIHELRLSSGAFNELDNIAVENASAAVPLPGSLPLLLLGLALGALVRRRRQ